MGIDANLLIEQTWSYNLEGWPLTGVLNLVGENIFNYYNLMINRHMNM